MSTLKVACIGAVGIVGYDLFASLASRLLGFPYAYATLGSWLIYLSVGFVVGRNANVPAAAVATTFVSFIDATVGWAISWKMGPGRSPSGTLSLGTMISVVLIVTLLGAALGALAGVAGHRAYGPPEEGS